MQTRTLNISLPKEMVKKIDEFAENEYRSRSELIREALRIYMQRMKDWNKIFRAGRETAKRMGIRSEKQIDDIVYEFRHGRKPH
ncbi:MAG: ribbon-helix-helix protein, CopG family [Candidatus Levybacteria bacterium]|nr:ribbon-helix-helix protein, CopG family [Candidatus Levybacteria bacterium]